MKKNRIYIFLIVLFISSCTSTRKQLDIAASFNEIQNIEDDSKINKIIQPYKAAVDIEMNKVIGFSEVEMPKLKDQPETVLGNFVADIVFEFSKTIDKETDFAVLNNGGLRSSMPAGNIAVRNVFELMPFDNKIVIVSMNGKYVNKLLSYISERGGVPVSGLTMKLERMNGTIVTNEAKINGKVFSSDSTYSIATSDYLSSGGDNMNFWSSGSIKVTGKKIRDSIIDYIRLKTTENKKLKPILDKRIIIVN